MSLRLTIRGVFGASAIAALGVGAGPLVAQDLPLSREVVQPLPPPEAAQLSAALQRLASDPRDLDSLIAAGNASLKLDDIDAALGFFARAEEIAPGDPRPKAGRAAAMVREENPFDALRLFDEAERAGASLDELAGERALAYDLVGDNTRAQALYRDVLARGEDPEAARRLAVSLAISGDQVGMERVLLPMLQRRDLAAYRARAFSLAILGKVEEATTISDAVMPKSMAARIEPYLRHMPSLTRSQQAAAANLGNFPRSVDIGRDDPRMAQFANADAPPPAPVQTADARLVPAGEPLGPAAEDAVIRTERIKSSSGRTTVTYRPIPPEPAPGLASAPEPEPIRQFEPPPSAVAAAEPAAAAIAQAAPGETEPSGQAPTEVAVADVPGPGLSVAASAEPIAAPAFDLAQVAGSAASAVPTPEPAAPVQVAAAEPASSPALAEPESGLPPQAFAAVVADVAEAAAGTAAVEPAPAATLALNSPSPVFDVPVPEPESTPEPASVADAFSDFQFSLAPTTRVADAVDIARIEPKRERVVKEEAKPAPPKIPRRFWVQLATGKDRTRLGADFRRISNQSKGVLKDFKAFLADWGETNRLLTGPFKTEAAARAFVTKLDEAGVKTFTFTSAEGEDVTAVAAR